MKKPLVSKPNYSVKRRHFDSNGRPLPWFDHGFGLFIDKETIQAQVDMLAVSNQKTEVEIILNKEKVDYDLYPTKDKLIYEQ